MDVQTFESLCTYFAPCVYVNDLTMHWLKTCWKQRVKYAGLEKMNQAIQLHCGLFNLVFFPLVCVESPAKHQSYSEAEASWGRL